jgi:hypothetical protein
MPSYSGVWTLTAQYQAKGAGNWPLPPLTGDIGLFAGGYTTNYTNVIQYISIASTGNAIDFGDLTLARQEYAGCSSATRGCFGGGNDATTVNVIDYVTILTTGNATDFGDLIVPTQGMGACSSSTRGVWGGGELSAGRTNAIQYITIATTGNATDFGDLLAENNALYGCASSTRGVFAGGFDALYEGVSKCHICWYLVRLQFKNTNKNTLKLLVSHDTS